MNSTKHWVWTNKLRSLMVMLFLITALIMLNLSVTPTNQLNDNVTSIWSTADDLLCHAISNTETLPDVSDHPPNHEKRKIFFLETSCSSDKRGKIYLTARQACAVESAARMNPNMDIYLLFASPGVIKDEQDESDRMLKVLTGYGNVNIMHFNIKKYVQSTHVEELWTNGNINKSKYPITHASDILRFLTLWKYGGIYLDLDVIVTKNLSSLPENFAGAEEGYLGSAALGFGLQHEGREYINDCLEELRTNFNGDEWGHNGPQLITRTIFRRCSQFDGQLLIRLGSCEDFVIFPPSAFYLLPYNRWKMYFDENLKDVIASLVDKSSYLVHVWNKLSVDTQIPKESINVPYLNLATKYCPGIVEQINKEF